MSFAGLKKQFNKANQYVSEKVGGAEKTQIPEDYVSMEKQIDATAVAVEEIVSKTNEFLQPNPVNRAKLSTARTVNKMRGQTPSSKYPQVEGQLGDCFLKHSQELGEDSDFGLALKDCGEAMKQLSEVKHSLDNNVSQNFIEPLEHLKNKELKEINHHRKKMESRRLDYDGKKRKHAKAGSNITQEEVTLAEEKFEESRDLAEEGMRNLIESDVEQVRQLQALMEAQLEFHRQAVSILEGIHESLDDRITTAETRPKTERVYKKKPDLAFDQSPSNGISNDSADKDKGPSADSSEYRKVKALYDFEPENEGELGFNEGDIITCTSEIDENWLEGEISGRSGYFPTNYVEFID
ncbi:Endophilin-A1 [Holothuria leucospilota]|uniref:Endophilin-A1 n=1 Tax=Holothuria leucospilota TaxID=206669 RepID=A0A9Q1H1F6_HOLLE|nr:Endophilin-A1 [Holothuria leucospilota]